MGQGCHPARQDPHGWSHETGDALRIAEGDTFWHQFTQHQGEIGDEGDDDPQGKGLGPGAQKRQGFEHRLQGAGHRRPTQRAAEDADQGDTDLYC